MVVILIAETLTIIALVIITMMMNDDVQYSDHEDDDWWNDHHENHVILSHESWGSHEDYVNVWCSWGWWRMVMIDEAGLMRILADWWLILHVITCGYNDSPAHYTLVWAMHGLAIVRIASEDSQVLANCILCPLYPFACQTYLNNVG